MAKLEKKSKIETGKKATKAASVKNRTPVARKAKPSGNVKTKNITVTKVTQKTSASVKTAKSSVKSASKSVATRSVATKKRVVKAAPPPKQTIAKPIATKPKVGKTPVTMKAVVEKAAIQPSPGQVKEKNKQVVAKPMPSLERNPISSDDLRVMLLERRQGIMKNFDDEIISEHEIEKPVVVGDIADIAQKSSENELSFHLAEVESRELEQIDRALDKINDGTYGVCEKCGENISPARLKALPFAGKCIRCQEEEERSHY